jgi:Clr5 domain
VQLVSRLTHQAIQVHFLLISSSSSPLQTFALRSAFYFCPVSITSLYTLCHLISIMADDDSHFKARDIEPEDWQRIKWEVHRLYMVEKNPLEWVQAQLQAIHGFQAW